MPGNVGPNRHDDRACWVVGSAASRLSFWRREGFRLASCFRSHDGQGAGMPNGVGRGQRWIPASAGMTDGGLRMPNVVGQGQHWIPASAGMPDGGRECRTEACDAERGRIMEPSQTNSDSPTRGGLCVSSSRCHTNSVTAWGNWRRGWDLNPRSREGLRFSRPACSATPAPLHLFSDCTC